MTNTQKKKVYEWANDECFFVSVVVVSQINREKQKYGWGKKAHNVKRTNEPHEWQSEKKRKRTKYIHITHPLTHSLSHQLWHTNYGCLDHGLHLCVHKCVYLDFRSLTGTEKSHIMYVNPWCTWKKVHTHTVKLHTKDTYVWPRRQFCCAPQIRKHFIHFGIANETEEKTKTRSSIWWKRNGSSANPSSFSVCLRFFFIYILVHNTDNLHQLFWAMTWKWAAI